MILELKAEFYPDPKLMPGPATLAWPVHAAEYAHIAERHRRAVLSQRSA
jgi:hypothetical protein